MNNLIQKRFGKLIVIERADSDKFGHPQWKCLCDCGNTKIVRGYNLTGKNTKSCGCLNIATIIKNNKLYKTTHGHTNTPTYEVWHGILQRCNNFKSKYYPRYGGRGITVCKRWLNFKNFLIDMGEKPKKLSLDRIDNNKSYCPENCRWATSKEQNRNQRSNRNVLYKGKIQCIAMWAEEYKIKYSTLYNRIYVSNYSIEKALTTPVQPRKGKLK